MLHLITLHPSVKRQTIELIYSLWPGNGPGAFAVLFMRSPLPA
jgi:hypothetical protein